MSDYDASFGNNVYWDNVSLAELKTKLLADKSKDGTKKMEYVATLNMNVLEIANQFTVDAAGWYYEAWKKKWNILFDRVVALKETLPIPFDFTTDMSSKMYDFLLCAMHIVSEENIAIGNGKDADEHYRSKLSLDKSLTEIENKNVKIMKRHWTILSNTISTTGNSPFTYQPGQFMVLNMSDILSNAFVCMNTIQEQHKSSLIRSVETINKGWMKQNYTRRKGHTSQN